METGMMRLLAFLSPVVEAGALLYPHPAASCLVTADKMMPPCEGECTAARRNFRVTITYTCASNVCLPVDAIDYEALQAEQVMVLARLQGDTDDACRICVFICTYRWASGRSLRRRGRRRQRRRRWGRRSTVWIGAGLAKGSDFLPNYLPWKVELGRALNTHQVRSPVGACPRLIALAVAREGWRLTIHGGLVAFQGMVAHHAQLPRAAVLAIRFIRKEHVWHTAGAVPARVVGRHSGERPTTAEQRVHREHADDLCVMCSCRVDVVGGSLA
eukprot:scaffold75592_cov33-Tisochrysis_lutea.AAC.3